VGGSPCSGTLPRRRVPPAIGRRRAIAWLLTATAVGACKETGPQPTPTVPGEELWEYATASSLPLAAVRDTRGLPYLYVAQKDGGVLVLRLAGSSRPSEVARVTRVALGDLDATTLVQQGTRLFVGLGDFFASQGSRAGLAVVDIRTPEQPAVTAKWISPSVLTGTTSLLADGAHVFLGAKRDGVFIFDVSDADTVRRIATLVPDPDFPTPNPSATAHPNARGFALAGNLLYVANDAGGVRVLDVSDRAAPREVAKYINAGIVNKPQAYNSIVIANNVAYVALDYCGLEILDVSNPLAIRQLGWWNPWNCHTTANVWFNSPGHTNQLVFDPSRRLVHLSAGASELLAVDVSDPARPVLRGQFEAATPDQAAWGIEVTPDETYVLYIIALLPYRGTWAGVRAVTSFR
jgi:hypothetical protein